MRITLRGYTVLIAAVLLIVGGYLGGYTELSILGVGALIAVCVALGASMRRWSMELMRELQPSRVPRGESCIGVVSVSNDASFIGSDLSVVDVCDLPDGVSEVHVPIVRLGARETQRAQYALPTHQRGIITVGPVVMERRDLFDFVRVRRRFGEKQKVWVHPRVKTLAAMPVGATRSMDGTVDKVEYGSIMFHALREYVPGDDLRHVHWRTSARLGQLMVREHIDTSLPRIVVLLDDRASAYDTSEKAATTPNFEIAVDAAASVCAAALRENLAVDLRTVSGSSLTSNTSTAGAAGHVDAFLDLLSGVRLHGEKASLPLAAKRLRQLRAGDTLIVLSSTAGVSDLGVVMALRDVFPSIMVGVFDESDAQVADTGASLMIRAHSIDEFAARWSGVRQW